MSPQKYALSCVTPQEAGLLNEDLMMRSQVVFVSLDAVCRQPHRRVLVFNIKHYSKRAKYIKNIYIYINLKE